MDWLLVLMQVCLFLTIFVSVICIVLIIGGLSDSEGAIPFIVGSLGLATMSFLFFTILNFLNANEWSFT